MYNDENSPYLSPSSANKDAIFLDLREDASAKMTVQMIFSCYQRCKMTCWKIALKCEKSEKIANTAPTLKIWKLSLENIFRFLRAWLRGDFQPGLKFRPAHRAEILLQLHAQFQPGRKTQWQSSLRCEYTVDAHASVPFSTRDEKNDSDYTDFSARLAGLKILAWFENTGLGFLARYFQIGL